MKGSLRSAAAVVLGCLAGLAMATFSAEGVRQRAPSASLRPAVPLKGGEPIILRSAALDAMKAAPSKRYGAGAPARLAPPSVFAPADNPSEANTDVSRAKISLIVDDLGLSPGAFKQVMGLSTPLTLAFLPYGNDLQRKADAARLAGHSVLLHLPMEPFGAADPGPNALTASMTVETLQAKTRENLQSFTGYTGVNNHMGSRLTADREAMRAVLATLREHNVFFLDSVTSAQTIADETSLALGLKTYRRDVFLDAAPGRQGLIDGFAALEAIASERGHAVGIIHPRPESIKVLTAWTTTAAARGFDLVTIEDLPSLDDAPARLAAALAKPAG